jgi:hypothetical protein
MPRYVCPELRLRCLGMLVNPGKSKCPGASLGYGTDVTWMYQLIPQIIINFRRHNTLGLQRSMMLLWACAGVPLGAYNVMGNFNIALQVQPQILTTLSLITWIQCHYYEDVSFPLVELSSCMVYLCSTRNGVHSDVVLL